MTDGASKGQQQQARKDELQEMLDRARAVSRRQATSTSTAAQREEAPAAAQFANIASNTFYKIMLDSEVEPKAKMEACARALAYAEDKDQARERLEEFKAFKEYLQFERKRMAQQIIDLTDTEAFAELKTVYDELNNSLISFEQKIAPLTDIVDAVYTLRMNGLTFDAFKEIILDKEAEARLAALRAQQEADFKKLSGEIGGITEHNAVLAEHKAFFGLGGTKRSAREEIARNNVLMEQKKVELAELTAKIQEVAGQAPRESTLSPEFVAAKNKLRELLDISSDDHKQRQRDLVNAAQSFVNTTEQRVAGISKHFEGMDRQINNLLDANFSMREIYAVLNDATKQAHVHNETQRQSLEAARASDEGELERMNRERNKRDLENYIGSLNASSVDTTAVLAELTNSSHRIKSMKDGNEQQISKTRQLHSSGVAGVADQLSTVLQAVSAAALGESSEMARMSLDRMNTKTQDLSQKEVIRLALGSHETNTELNKALKDLEQYGEVVRTATTITREGLKETKDLLGKLEHAARDVQRDVKESFAVAADVVAGREDAAPKGNPAETPKTGGSAPDPFKLGR
jgi:hypothetical protein